MNLWILQGTNFYAKLTVPYSWLTSGNKRLSWHIPSYFIPMHTVTNLLLTNLTLQYFIDSYTSGVSFHESYLTPLQVEFLSMSHTWLLYKWSFFPWVILLYKWSFFPWVIPDSYTSGVSFHESYLMCGHN